jgi:flavorubredoxin
MIGAPTYEGALFPPVLDVLNHAAVKRILNKRTAVFGSYGWSGGALRNIKQIIEPIKWELEDSFEFNGSPDKEDLNKAREFGKAFAEKIKNGS